MTLIGPDKFKKDNVREVPPVMDDKGEFTEVQVLEEGEVFDPDQFLDQLLTPTPSLPRVPPVSCPPEIRECQTTQWKHLQVLQMSKHKLSQGIAQDVKVFHHLCSRRSGSVPGIFPEANPSLLPQDGHDQFSMQVSQAPSTDYFPLSQQPRPTLSQMCQA